MRPNRSARANWSPRIRDAAPPAQSLQSPRDRTTPARVFGPLSMEPSRQVCLEGESDPLDVRTEFRHPRRLVSRPGVVWSRRRLIDAVWGGSGSVTTTSSTSTATCGASSATTLPTRDSSSRCAAWATEWDRTMGISRGFGMRRRPCSPRHWCSRRRRSPPGVAIPVVGPPLFREHLHRPASRNNSDDQLHAEMAYRDATRCPSRSRSRVAALTAFVVTAYRSRRLQRSISEVSAAATAIAEAATASGSAHHGSATSSTNSPSRSPGWRIDYRRSESTASVVRRPRHEIRTPVSVLGPISKRWRMG